MIFYETQFDIELEISSWPVVIRERFDVKWRFDTANRDSSSSLAVQIL